jgi:hypothetical protein
MVEYMEWIKGKITLVNDTYGELEINFPTLNGNRFGNKATMPVIQEVEVEHTFTTGDVAITKLSEWHLSSKSQAAIIGFDSSDCIERGKIGQANIATAAPENLIERVSHYPKQLYPYDSIFFGAKMNSGDVKVRVGYTMRAVNQNELMRSLIPR